MFFEDQLDVVVMEVDLYCSFSSMRGDYVVIKDGVYELVYYDFMDCLEVYVNE